MESLKTTISNRCSGQEAAEWGIFHENMNRRKVQPAGIAEYRGESKKRTAWGKRGFPDSAAGMSSISMPLATFRTDRKEIKPYSEFHKFFSEP